ncbi:MAG TPA: RNA repair transcriptional activator RtcR [Pirellulaceae bacterium]|nr:RNA repair transcriptional activator RtcR [Pirellulaceae bacterium]
MKSPRQNVVLGILGSRLDHGRSEARWNHWRPTVALCQHEELLVHRLELLFQPQEQQLAALVADDIRSVSPETEVCLHSLAFRDPWDFEEVFAVLHGFARGYPFRTDDEDYLIHITTGSHVQQICLFLLAESRHLPGALLQTSPPPRDLSGEGTFRIIDLDLSKYDVLATRFALEQQESLTFLKSGIETRNAAFNALIEQIERVASASTVPLLITGPTGAGKSQLAARIYELKRHREQVRGGFVEANCATLRGDQAMSALFGHVKGAYTGATNARRGLLMAADQGVLFLDEIGDLGLDEQAMLLRAIEDKRFLPVGSDQEVASNFQLLAGTNRDLQVAVREGRFREDLLARINMWTFCLPALAERREDIAPNLDYELDRYAARTGQKVTMNKEARQQFLSFAESNDALWSANFRDLNAAVTRMGTLARAGRITTEDVQAELARLRHAWSRTRCTEENSLPALRSLLSAEQLTAIDLFDQVQLETVIRACRASASLSAAGRQLFAASRLSKAQPNDADRLRKYLARFGLSWQDLRD